MEVTDEAESRVGLGGLGVLLILEDSFGSKHTDAVFRRNISYVAVQLIMGQNT